MSNHKKALLLFSALLFCASVRLSAQTADYSVLSVPEESGLQFVKITNDADFVCMPEVKRSSRNIAWYSCKVIGLSPDGSSIGFLSFRDNRSNIFVKSLDKPGMSVQRTRRQMVTDFAFSPDGKYICFAEKNGREQNIYQTDANQGFVCRQITSGARDYNPTYTPDMSQILFSRHENRSFSIWSHNLSQNFLSSYTPGMNPSAPSPDVILCARSDQQGKFEIWRLNPETGVEECVISDASKSFTSPSLSPDGKWIVMVGSSTRYDVGKAATKQYHNTDIYVAKTDGSRLTQLTYHAADDLSPVWSRDGKEIYFVSQRGSATKTANIWKINFNR